MNKTFLIGTLGKDATSKQINDKWLIEFTLATNETYVKNGEKVKVADWHNCRYWTKLDKLTGYLNKGTKIGLEGKNKTDSYEKDGQKKYISYVLVTEITDFMGSKKEQSNHGNDEENGALPF